jgi:hypothetical protein
MTNQDNIAAKLEHLSGQVAALIAYVAHIPGADQVSAKDLRAHIVVISPPRQSRAAPLSRFDAAMHTVGRISELARQIAELREAGGDR